MTSPTNWILAPGLCICRNAECAIPYGLCHCGCGGKTNIAPQSSTVQGCIKGYPLRYIRNHQNRIPRDWSIELVEIDGKLAAYIPLTKNKRLLVDADSLDLISGTCYLGRGGYAHHTNHGKTESIHRFVVGAKEGQIVDHINRNKLDCRSANLRFVTAAENTRHSGVRNQSKTGYKNVTRPKSKKRPDYEIYGVLIFVDGKKRSFGYFKTAVEAARHADKINKELFGRFAVLNFPEEKELRS